MKKILYIASIVPHYNVDLYKTLEKHYKSLNEEFYLLSMKNPPQEGRSGLSGKIIDNHLFYDDEYRGNIGKFKLYWQKNLLSIINKIKPDKIIMSGQVGNLTSWIVAYLYKQKVYTWQCGYEYNKSPIKDIIQKQYLKLFKHHLAYHTGAKKFLLKYKIPENKISILHNTINEQGLKKATYDESRAYICDQLKIDINSKILLYVGTVLEEKKLTLLIDMMEYLSNDYKLVIIGNGPFLETIRTLSKNNTNIFLLGSKFDDKHFYFAGSDLFLLPGTGGLALNEAIFYNLPILSGYADGSAEDLVIDDFNGYRIDKKNPKEISEIVEKIFKNDTIEKFKKNTIVLLNKYSFNKYIERFINEI